MLNIKSKGSLSTGQILKNTINVPLFLKNIIVTDIDKRLRISINSFHDDDVFIIINIRIEK